MFLASCAVTDSMYADLTGTKNLTFSCPDVQIIEDGKEMTIFRPGLGQDIIDIEFEAQFTDVSAECSFAPETLMMTLVIQYTLEANRGPAARSDTVTLPYFVALVTRDQDILARAQFESSVTFQAGKRRVRLVEEIEQIFPVKDNNDGGRYEILASFALSQDQLRYNREKRLR